MSTPIARGERMTNNGSSGIKNHPVVHCSFWADHFDGMSVHLNHRDVTMVVYRTRRAQGRSTPPQALRDARYR